jgi:hypothetical protein
MLNSKIYKIAQHGLSLHFGTTKELFSLEVSFEKKDELFFFIQKKDNNNDGVVLTLFRGKDKRDAMKHKIEKKCKNLLSANIELDKMFEK